MINLRLADGKQITLVPTNNHLPYAFKVEGRLPSNTKGKYIEIIVDNLYFFLMESRRYSLSWEVLCLMENLHHSGTMRDVILAKLVELVETYMPYIDEDYALNTATEIENILWELYYSYEVEQC